MHEQPCSHLSMTVKSTNPSPLSAHRHSFSGTGRTWQPEEEKREWEEERVREKGSTASKDTSTSRFSLSNNNQPSGEAVSQEHPHRTLCSFHLNQKQRFYQLGFIYVRGKMLQIHLQHSRYAIQRKPHL